jgi:hypothetical protein
MKQSVISLVKKVSVVTVSFMMIATIAQAAQLKINDSNKKLINPQRIKQTATMQRVGSRGIDPAVVNLQVSQGAGGRVNVTATVRNVGSENFVAAHNQASVTLQVHNPRISGPSGYKTIATRGFSNLSTSGSIVVTGAHVLNGFVEWNDPTLDQGECNYSQEIIARINYDVDINMDGNEQNDDIRNSNNMKKKTFNYVVQCPW